MSSDDIAIRVENLSKCYQIYERPEDRLKQAILPRLSKLLGRRPHPNYYKEFWALRNLSFQIHKGESLGVIGRNGAGKSTLLQLVCGMLHPTEGTIQVNGRVAALLELGSGFNPDFTGRENVYLNGSILGLSQQELDERIDDIIGFSEIGDFVDQPVKTYSSGMFVRLAFAVQVFSQPEVLIVDEALSIGDVFFQQKCFSYIRSIVNAGTTLLFVSHDLSAVRNICDRALLLKDGKIDFNGPPDEAVSWYYGHKGPPLVPQIVVETFRKLPEISAGELYDEIVTNNILASARSRHGQGKIKLVAACFYNDVGRHSYNVALLGNIRILVLLRAYEAARSLSVGIHLYDRMNNLVFAAGTRNRMVVIKNMDAGDEMVVEMHLNMAVQPGEYTFSLGCAEPSSEGPNLGEIQDRCEGLGPIRVDANQDMLLPFYGIAQLPFEARVVEHMRRLI